MPQKQLVSSTECTKAFAFVAAVLASKSGLGASAVVAPSEHGIGMVQLNLGLRNVAGTQPVTQM